MAIFCNDIKKPFCCIRQDISTPVLASKTKIFCSRYLTLKINILSYYGILTHQWMFKLLERWAVHIFPIFFYSNHFHVVCNKYLKKLKKCILCSTLNTRQLINGFPVYIEIISAIFHPVERKRKHLEINGLGIMNSNH